MKDLYIVGAGGFGREVYNWLLDAGSSSEWQFCGFLDDNTEALKGLNYGKGVVAPVTGFAVQPSHLFVCGIGEVSTKMKVCKPLLEQEAQFQTVIHPTAVVGKNVQLGKGVVLCPRVILTCDIKIGDMAMINCSSSVGHDATIGDWCTMSAHCDLTGYAVLGCGVFMGSGARVIPGKSVGDNAVVGAGSVVVQSVAAGQKVFGNPARTFDSV